MEKLPVKVSGERWQEAQAWELQHWMKENSFLIQSPLRKFKTAIKRLFGISIPEHGVGDDWNGWWREKFNGYRELPKEMGKAVELGCGPYTNIRMILDRSNIEEVHCSDPLADHYITFKGRWLADAARTGRVIIDNHPIEECPYATESFSCVVVINVLDHVRDARLCLEQTLRILKPGGFLVFGQDLSNEEDLSKVGELMRKHGAEEDIGHPIRLDHNFIDKQLLPSVTPLQYQILPRDQGRNPEGHYGTYLLVGSKK